MKLITKAIAEQTPAIGETEDLQPEEVKIQAKFFTPWASWTWYMTEYDPETGEAFGYVINALDPQNAELGYFSLVELAETRGPYGLKIERDRYFGPAMLSDVMLQEAT